MGFKRAYLTDGSNRWFAWEEALFFRERTTFNGNNHISVATGSQWEHEGLYYTKNGSWVFHVWSDREGSAESYELIEEEQALKWLAFHDIESRDDDFAKLPESVRLAVGEATSGLEV